MKMYEIYLDLNIIYYIKTIKLKVCYCSNRCIILWFHFDEVLFPGELYIFIFKYEYE